MRCYICNKALTDKEVVFNEDLQQDEPCTNCLDIALDAAYSGAFSEWDDTEFVPVLDTDFDETDAFYLSYPTGDNNYDH